MIALATLSTAVLVPVVSASTPATPGTADSASSSAVRAKAAPSVAAQLAAVNGLNPFATVTGKVYMSEDATGTNDPAGAPVKVRKANSSSTVRAAYLLAAGTPGNVLVNGDITLNGSPLY